MYGRGDGSHPCTCSCFDGQCENDSTPDPSDDFFNIQNLSNDDKKDKGNLAASITDINGIGLISITFNHKVDLEYLQSLSGRFLINENLLEIKIKPSDKTLERDLNLTWKVDSFDGRILKIQITFIKPLDVSMGSRYDFLEVDFIRYHNLWYSDDILSYLNKESYHMERAIQKQMPNTPVSRSILGLNENTKTVLMVSLVAAFTMNMFLSG